LTPNEKVSDGGGAPVMYLVGLIELVIIVGFVLGVQKSMTYGLSDSNGEILGVKESHGWIAATVVAPPVSVPPQC